MNAEKFFVANKSGEKLVGEVLKSSDKSDKVIIAIHGYITDRTRSITRITDLLVENGHHCIRFDLSGCGESEGDHAKKTISDWAKDSLCIIEYAQSLGYKRFAIHGSSLGCSSAMICALRKPIERMCFQSPGTFYFEKMKRKGELDEWKDKGFRMKTNSKGVTWRSDYAFIEDAKNHDFIEVANQVSAETLLLYGTLDKLALLDKIKEMVDLMPNASLVVLEGAGHNLSIDGDFHESDKIILDWFNGWS